tara:strand:+ start:113 stop:1873 length:1761 start_codon:yes stop_codon:yes gene_type:complete
MKIFKLLSRIFLPIYIIIFFFIVNFLKAQEQPVDIWNLEKKSKTDNVSNAGTEIIEAESDSTFKIKSKLNNEFEILKDEYLQSNIIVVSGIYDPQENGLNIDMWSNSKGEKIKTLFNKINLMNLSSDANEILEIALLTNSYFPKNDISIDEFSKFKSDYLIKTKNLDLIKKYLLNNKGIPNNDSLVRYYIDEYLSISDVKNACSIFQELNLFFKDDYLSKFKIYCLVNDNNLEEAQLLLDLKKENEFKDIFFEKKINYLIGYKSELDNEISDQNILNFHLSHRVNNDFTYIPTEKTSKIIWKYLSSNNLLEKADLVDLEDVEKIKFFEKATNDKNYTEQELFELYKRFQFTIDQLLSAKENYKLFQNYEGRALLYQRLLLTTDIQDKLDLCSKLKESFVSDGLENIFTEELSKILKEIKYDDVPSNYSTFYEINLITEQKKQKKIKYNNKIVHQSKLINYFLGKTDRSNTEKEANDFLKKIKKDKKYIFTTKDIMLLESLKSDGIEILDKYSDLYKVNPDIPYDIQLLIKNYEIGMVLLRLVEIIGEDNLEDLGTETLNFIVSTLNVIDMDNLRNKILLKVLPLKV